MNPLTPESCFFISRTKSWVIRMRPTTGWVSGDTHILSRLCKDVWLTVGVDHNLDIFIGCGGSGRKRLHPPKSHQLRRITYRCLPHRQRAQHRWMRTVLPPMCSRPRTIPALLTKLHVSDVTEAWRATLRRAARNSFATCRSQAPAPPPVRSFSETRDITLPIFRLLV
jgi:hypothetical protein